MDEASHAKEWILFLKNICLFINEIKRNKIWIIKIQEKYNEK